MLKLGSCLVIATAFATSAFAATVQRAPAAPEPFRIDASFGYQGERLDSPIADSLALGIQHGTSAGIELDFRVMSLPMKTAEPPSVHVLGDVGMARRTIATGEPATLEDLPIVELGAGFEIDVPLALVDRNAGTAFYVGYQGGVLLVRAGSGDFLRTKHVYFGFQRTHGFFEGTEIEMAYGRDEAYGLAYAAGRWLVRIHVESSLGLRFARSESGVPATGTERAPFRLYTDLAFDTDGGAGPDGIRARVGLTLDAGSVLRRVVGAAE